MRYKCVIFDLDGTLLDTLEDLADATNAALMSADLPVRTLDEVRQFVGNGVERLIRRAVPEGTSQEKFDGTFAYFKEYYGKHCKDKTQPYAGVLELLKNLRDRGVLCAVVSNKFDGAVKPLCEEYFPGLLETAVGESADVHKKPAPDMVSKVMELLHVKKEQCVYVGDSEVDIATAKNAELDCISVTWGFRSEELLREHGATHIVHDTKQLLKEVM